MSRPTTHHPPRSIAPPRPARAFLQAISSVTALCTVVGLAGFTLSTILQSTDGPPLVDPLTGRRLFITFDGFMWTWIAGPMFIPHVRVKYRALYNHWQMRAASALGLLSIAIGHGAWLIYPDWKGLDVITNFVAFLLINVLPLVVAKWLVVRESKSPSPASSARSFPSQHKHSTIMFPGIIIALTSYGVSLPMENAMIQAMCLMLVLGTGAIICIAALKYRFQLKGHFDYVLMLWCAYHIAPVARRAILAVSITELGQANPIVLIYGYRGLLSMFVIMFDDLMEATFGVWPKSLWGTFFMRLIESLVSFTMALNGINQLGSVLTYVATNVFITTLKDSGLQDDVRYLMMNGYFIWAPVKRYFPGSSHQPRPALESMRSLPSITPTSADAGAAAGSSSDSHSSSATPAPVPIVSHAMNPAVPSLVSWWFPPRMVKHTTQDQVKALSVDLGIQIERSELTLMSRVSSFACVAACYCLTQVWQRTATSRLVLHQKESAKFAAGALLVLSLAELVVSRAIAVAIMNRKIRRLHKLMRLTGVTAEALQMHQQGGGGAVGTKTNNTSSALVVPIRSAAVHQSPSLASGLTAESSSLASMQRILPPGGGGDSASQHRGDGGPPPPIHAMWSTGLPRQKSFQHLVFALIVFTTLVHFGAW